MWGAGCHKEKVGTSAEWGEKEKERGLQRRVATSLPGGEDQALSRKPGGRERGEQMGWPLSGKMAQERAGAERSCDGPEAATRPAGSSLPPVDLEPPGQLAWTHGQAVPMLPGLPAAS